MRTQVWLLTAIVMVGGLVGCGSSASDTAPPSPTEQAAGTVEESVGEDASGEPSEPVAKCDRWVPSEEVARLVGRDLGESNFPQPRPYACSWGPPANGVQIEHFEAGSLGPKIARMIDSVLRSDRPISAELRRGLVRGRDLLTADREVCRTFSLLAQALGYPAGTKTVILDSTEPDTSRKVGAEHCSADRITRITITSTRVGDDELQGAADVAARLVPDIHRRFRLSTGA